jgi:pyrroloquinoline-quinone synthase
VTREQFRESLLQVMEKKTHWAWPLFIAGRVAREKLHVHFEQEYAVVIRDFSTFVGRAYVQCPIPSIRRELAENLYEGETGGLQAGRAHSELFLEIPKGLGFDVERFLRVTLLPGSLAFREAIDHLTQHAGWAIAMAVVTLFIEGSSTERATFEWVGSAALPLEEHPLVVHYGLPVERLAHTRAHLGVESSHRRSAWKNLLDHVPEEDRTHVLRSMNVMLDAWQAYRDDVAKACGLSPVGVR